MTNAGEKWCILNYQFLLNNDDLICNQIVQLISQRTVQSVTKTELSKRLSLTNYQLNKYFDLINSDLMTISGEEPTYIDEQDHDLWHANNLNTLIVQKLTLLYLERSNMLPVFEYSFFYSNQYSKAQFMREHFMSKSAFFRSLKQLDKDLNQISFYQPVSHYQDDEFIIRLKLFQLYYTAYNGVSTPFAELDGLVETIYDCFNDYFDKPFKPTQRAKFGIFLKIWVLRMQNGFTISNLDLPNSQDDVKYGPLMVQIREILEQALTVNQDEIDYLYCFLYTQGYLTLTTQQNDPADFPIATKLTQQMIAEVVNNGILVDNITWEKERLTANLMQIHLQFTTFYVEPTTFIDPDQISFFQDLYPSFDIVITKFITKLQADPDLQISQKMAVNLYFSYMFALINSIPPTALKDKIFICVDFSEGTLYSEYVVKSLGSFNHAHIIIEPDVTDNTDIYISDFRTDDVSVPQIIWQDPPTPNDWSQLADMILDQKKSKLNHLKPQIKEQ